VRSKDDNLKDRENRDAKQELAQLALELEEVENSHAIL
jgi:hypothetical protein